MAHEAPVWGPVRRVAHDAYVKGNIIPFSPISLLLSLAPSFTFSSCLLLLHFLLFRLHRHHHHHHHHLFLYLSLSCSLCFAFFSPLSITSFHSSPLSDNQLPHLPPLPRLARPAPELTPPGRVPARCLFKWTSHSTTCQDLSARPSSPSPT